MPAHSREKPEQDGKTRNDYRSASWPALQVSCQLLDFDGSDAFELLLDRLGLVLGRAFFQRLGSAVDEVLGFLQAERSDFAYSLDGVDLVRAGILENDLEFGLLFCRRSSRSTAAAGNDHRGRSRGRNAETLFELLYQCRRFKQAEANNLFFQ